ncbi:MAG: ABC transporter substrate-binding protein [Treponema sp.]|nr:ABC transporter substrate-binding protein [Treponema sp.]
MRLNLIKYFAIALSALALAACSPRDARQANEMRFGFISEPATLDPLSPSNSADGRSILFNVFEGLVKPDSRGDHLPALAESFVIGEDGRVYDFTLRANALFHDGAPLTPQDVKFTLDAAIAAGLVGMSAIESVEITGARGVRVTLRLPDPDFLPNLTVGVVRAGSENRETVAVGTGPFFIESHVAQQSLTLRRFDGYWREGLPHLDAVTIVFFADLNAMFLALQGGSIDGALFTGALGGQLDPARFDVTYVDSAMVQGLILNNSAPPLNDPLVRQALNHAIDRQEVIDAAFFGQGRQAGGPVIPGLDLYYEPWLLEAWPHDQAKARELLAQAGFSGGMSLEIVVPSNFTQHVDTAQVIVAQLARVGVDARIRLVDWATWLVDVNRERSYQATVISVDGRTVSPRSFLARYRSDSPSNFINFSSAEFDRAFDLAQAAQSEESRIALYREAQRAIAREAGSVYIQDILGFMAFRAGAFGGAVGYPLSAMDFAAIYAR